MNNRLYSLLLVVWLAYTGSSVAEESLAETRAKAEKGDALAQAKLALCYQNGQGVPKDVAEAANWSRNAAEQGNADAQFLLGHLHRGIELPNAASGDVKASDLEL